jgi:prepilin-type N-terminal cleavage/methylation domain-containing protein
MLKKLKSERGFSLIEVLIAVALVGIIAAAFSMGLFTTSKNVILSDNLTTAESLARTMMEDIKEGPFMGDDNPGEDEYRYNEYYSGLVPQEFVDMGYSVFINADTVVFGLQKITVNVLHNDAEIWALEGYKANR